MAIDAGSVYSQLILDTGKYEQGLKEAERQMKTFTENLSKAGKNVEKAGEKLTKYVTVPVTAMGGLSVKAAIDFESAFAGVRKTVDASEKDFARLEKGIMDMSKEIPASATAIAEVAEAAGQLGIETENILDFTRVMIDLGEATNLSADEAATALARFANITQMSQQDFDRLGSTIVDLGNNLATTEAEIVAMGLRLAGAGSQIGLTEAQILSFAGALSSVGIEAEAGGSAFSKVMIDMQLAVETNSGRLREFAKVAGMSSKDFAKAFKEDAASAIIAFIKGLGDAEKRGLSSIKILDDMEIKEVRLRDALLRAAGASNVFSESLEIGTRAWEENTALTKEAEQRYKTTASQIQIAKNYLTEAGIVIGDLVVPHLVKLAEMVKNAAEWFSNLNPSTQETIVKMAALAAAAGPTIKVASKLTQGISGIVGLLGNLSSASTVAAAATGTMASGIGTAGAAAKLGATLLNPWALGITAATAGAVALGYHLSQDAIPQVQLFGDEVSKSTKQAVSAFLELEDEAMSSLKQLHWGGQTVTSDMVQQIGGNFNQMRSQIVSELNTQKEEALKELGDLFSNSLTMTAEQKQKLVEMTVKSYDDQIKKTDEGTKRILEILQNASKENRELKQEELQEITTIQENMRETAIRTLSESESEQLAIMERLKSGSGKLAAQQAADIVKASIEQKNKTIAEAEEEYNKRLKWAAQLRAAGGEEAERMADEVKAAAERQRDETVKYAEDIHFDIVQEAKAQAGEYVYWVDWMTGEVKKKWQVLWEWFKKGFNLNFSGSQYTPAGRSIVEGVEEGIKQRQREAEKTMEQLAKDMQERFGVQFDMHSPSRVMMEYGRYIDEGLAEGIRKHADDPKNAMIDMAQIIGNALSKAMDFSINAVEKIKNDFKLWASQNEELAGSAEYLNKQLSAQQAEFAELSNQIAVTQQALNDITYEYGANSPEALKYQNNLISLQIEQQELTNRINDTKEAIATVNFNNLLEGFKKAQEHLSVTTSIAQKEYQLWLLSTNTLEDSTEGLTEKIRLLKEQQESLNPVIENAKALYEEAVIVYGAASEEALKYKDALLELQLQQEQLGQKVKETTKALQEQSMYYMDEKGVLRQGRDPRAGGTAPQRAAVLKEIYEGADILRDFGYSDDVVDDWIKNQKKNYGFNAYAKGTMFSEKGWALVGEEGPELIDLPRGSRVYTAQETKDILSKQGNSITQNITINSPIPHSPAEERRKYLQISRQLAMEWGFS